MKKKKTLLPTKAAPNRSLLKTSLILFQASFVRVFPLALILAIVVFIPRFILDLEGRNLFASDPLTFFTWPRLWILVINLISIVIFIAILWRIHCIERGKHEPFREDFWIGLKKVIYAFVALLIAGIILFAISTSILVFAGLLSAHQLIFTNYALSVVVTFAIFIGQFFLILYIFTLFVFLLPIIAIEEKGVIAAIKRSVGLAWNFWGRIFFLQIVPWVCYAALLLLLRSFLSIDVHIYFLESRPHALWISILQLLLFAIFIIWSAALLLVQLRDLELRKHIKDKHAV